MKEKQKRLGINDIKKYKVEDDFTDKLFLNNNNIIYNIQNRYIKSICKLYRNWNRKLNSKTYNIDG